MKEWDKVRISDEEFIQGIYSKAKKQEELQEDISNVSRVRDSRKWRMKHIPIMSSLVAAACAILVIGTSKLSSLWNEGESQSLPQQTQTRLIENGDTPSLAEDVYPVNLVGTIKSVEKTTDQHFIVLAVREEYKAEFGQQIQIAIKEPLYEMLIEQYGDLTGMGVFVTVTKTQGNYSYDLCDERSLYIEEKTENGAMIYKNMDGELMEN